MSLTSNVFHDAAIPAHTHSSCDFCHQLHPPTDLLRCETCQMSKYCSEECRSQALKSGHKLPCTIHSYRRVHAHRASKNANAWAEFAQWLDYHRDTLSNAALTMYIAFGPGSEAEHTLHLQIIYLNDASLPIERKFRVGFVRFVHQREVSLRGSVEDMIPHSGTWEAVMNTRMDLVKELQARTAPGDVRKIRAGTYLLTLKFGTLGIPDESLDTLYEAFPITDKQLDAYISDDAEMQDLTEEVSRMVREGEKWRYCCSRETGFECCCGGWTHDRHESAPTLGAQSHSDAEEDQAEQILPAAPSLLGMAWGILSAALSSRVDQSDRGSRDAVRL